MKVRKCTGQTTGAHAPLIKCSWRYATLGAGGGEQGEVRASRFPYPAPASRTFVFHLLPFFVLLLFCFCTSLLPLLLLELSPPFPSSLVSLIHPVPYSPGFPLPCPPPHAFWAWQAVLLFEGLIWFSHSVSLTLLLIKVSVQTIWGTLRVLIQLKFCKRRRVFWRICFHSGPLPMIFVATTFFH